MSKAHGLTRRLIVFTGHRGVFCWRCPDCHGIWSESASSQRGSTTR